MNFASCDWKEEENCTSEKYHRLNIIYPRILYKFVRKRVIR